MWLMGTTKIIEMKKFALLFRTNITNSKKQPSPEEMNMYMSAWMQWVNEIETKGQLVEGGNHFSKQGKVLRPNSKFSVGPYVAEDVSVAGYILIVAQDLEDASSIAQNCPILKGENTSVEIRELASPGN